MSILALTEVPLPREGQQFPSPACGEGRVGALALPALAADPRHMGTVAADRLATLLARPPGLGRRKLMCCPPLVSGPSASSGNLSLALLTHAGKAATSTR